VPEELRARLAPYIDEHTK